jgi:hypothetical protein
MDQREPEVVKRGPKGPTRATRGQKKLTGASRVQKWPNSHKAYLP